MTSSTFDFSDYLEIQRLMHTFNLSFDAGDANTFAGLFSPDGVLVSRSGTCVTAEERRQKVLESAARPPHRHFTTNAMIEPDPADPLRASATACFIYMELDPDRVETRSMGTYRDELVKHDGRWLFQRREAVTERFAR
jgi:uncharacterized protein (TIGR02246 family)